MKIEEIHTSQNMMLLVLTSRTTIELLLIVNDCASKRYRLSQIDSQYLPWQVSAGAKFGQVRRAQIGQEQMIWIVLWLPHAK